MLQMHHLLNSGAEVNQRDEKGFTPLHRAAYLAHYNGYLELYEYLLVRLPWWRVMLHTRICVACPCSRSKPKKWSCWH